jgi:hypothetical protein
VTDTPATRSRLTLWLVLAVCAAPVVLSFAAYYLMPARDTTNYGELLPTGPAPPLAGKRAGGGAWSLADERNRWVIVVAAPAACDDACAKRLYATRQARTMQGRERERIVRVWLVTDGGRPAQERRDEHPDLVVIDADPRSVDRLPRGAGAIYVVDPLGNQVLAWPPDPDIKGVARDLAKLLRTSRIG